MWRVNNKASGFLGHGGLVVLGLGCILSLTVGQYFDPEVSDKTYLDNLQTRIEVEVNATRRELYTQAKVIEDITRQFVAAQLKENLFIALRVLAEKELQQWNEQKLRLAVAKNGGGALLANNEAVSSDRRGKQDDGDDDDADTTIRPAGSSTLRPADAIPFQMGLIPQVANLVKAIFGGNKNINLTSYVSSASRLLPKPVGNQVVGLVGLIATPTQTTTLRPLQFRKTRPPVRRVVPQINEAAFSNNEAGFQNQADTFQNNLATSEGLHNIDFAIQQHAQDYALSVGNNGLSNQESQVQTENFQDFFTNVGHIKTGSTIRPHRRTSNKPYVYNPSGSKGVGVSDTSNPHFTDLYNEPDNIISPSQGQYAIRPPSQFQQKQQSQNQLQQKQRPQTLLQDQLRPQSQYIQQQQRPQSPFLKPQQLPQQEFMQKPHRPQNQFQQPQNKFPPQEQQGQFQVQQQPSVSSVVQPQATQGQVPAFPPSQPISTSPSPDEEEDEDYDEDGRKRQFSLGSLLPALLGNVFRSTVAPIAVQNQPLVQAAASSSTGTAGSQPQLVGQSGQIQPQVIGQIVQTQPQAAVQQGTPAAVPVAAMMAQGFNLQTFAMDVGKNLGDIFRVMPDIFRGAREGVQLLQTLSSVFGGLEGLAGIADLGGIF